VVRKKCGIDFPGITDSDFVRRTGQVDIPPPFAVRGTGELDVPGVGRFRSGTFTRTENGMFAYAMFGPGAYRVAVYEWLPAPPEDSTAIPLNELREAVGRVLGADVPMTEPAPGVPAGLSRSVGSNSRQAERYREGRVFLVGDAAHVHSGVGGPGLNLGMQDVLNLGWKLAAAVHGWAPDGLLDSYQDERLPVGDRVIMQTRAQTALLSPGPHITALRQLFTELLGDELNVRRVADLLAGADTCYPTNLPGPAHPLAGRWMPDLGLALDNAPSSAEPPAGTNSPVRVAELMRAGRPVLLDLGGRHDLVDAAQGWVDRIDIVSASVVDSRSVADPVPAAVLVRPDSHVVWACDPESPAVVDSLQVALRTWFGDDHAINRSFLG
jgi:hypothetical protein